MKTPRHTTHVRLDTRVDGTKKRMALLAVKDMDCMAGSAGKVTFLRQLNKGRYEELGSFAFDGKWPITEKENK
jgi:hypothetical protein